MKKISRAPWVALMAAISIWHVSASMVQANGAFEVGAASITINGTSNLHDWHTATKTVRLTRVELAAGATNALEAGALTAFELAVPVTTLKSGEKGLDENLYKALDAKKNPDITYRLTRLEPGTTPETAHAVGMLTIVGVEREVAFDITTKRDATGLTVKGQVELLMTDYGIKPPRAMLGMLRTGPKVTISFEVLLGAASGIPAHQ